MPLPMLSEALPQEIKDFIQRETMSAGTPDVTDQGWDKILEFMNNLVQDLECSTQQDPAMLGKILVIYRRLKLSEMIKDPALFRMTLRQATSSHPHSYCTKHPIPVEDAIVQPVPLHEVLNLRFNDNGLHDIPSTAYWHLRELTRPYRQFLADLNDDLCKYEPLGPAEKDARYDRLAWLKESTVGSVLESAELLCDAEWTAASHIRSMAD